MRRVRLKKIKRFRKINFLSSIIILIVIFSFIILSYISNKISPILLSFAENQTTKLSNLIITRAVTKQITNGIEIDKLFSMVQNKDGEIQTIDFNPVVVNKVLNTTTSIVQLYLKAIEQGNIDILEIPEDVLVEYDKDKLKKGIIYELPVLAVTRNALLSNLGPRIPVRLNLVGNVISNINTKINQYGINNALIEVYVKIQVTEQVNLPFISKRVTVSSDIPVAMKIVQGKIPDYYQAGGIDKDSSILSLPIE